MVVATVVAWENQVYLMDKNYLNDKFDVFGREIGIICSQILDICLPYSFSYLTRRRSWSFATFADRKESHCRFVSVVVVVVVKASRSKGQQRLPWKKKMA